jgi:hypothetical protein
MQFGSATPSRSRKKQKSLHHQASRKCPRCGICDVFLHLCDNKFILRTLCGKVTATSSDGGGFAAAAAAAGSFSASFFGFVSSSQGASVAAATSNFWSPSLMLSPSKLLWLIFSTVRRCGGGCSCCGLSSVSLLHSTSNEAFAKLVWIAIDRSSSSAALACMTFALYSCIASPCLVLLLVCIARHMAERASVFGRFQPVKSGMSLKEETPA